MTTATKNYIKTIDELHQYLQVAIKLEQATIPPYLCALYTIKPDKNYDASNLIRTVVIQEMLHMVLAANVLNAVGGHPFIDRPGFVADYPTKLPDGEEDFEVSLLPFSEEAITTFLKIERPGPERHKLKAANAKPLQLEMLKDLPDLPPDVHFFTIGDFYNAILQGMDHLCEQLGEKNVFTGDPSLQVTQEFYYNGGGQIITVTDLKSAHAALQEIIEQGEGLPHEIDDAKPFGDELAHYYRFQEIQLKQMYQQGDHPNHPTGATFDVDYSADSVYPMIPNPKTALYPEGSELRKASDAFNILYTNLLGQLQQAFNGDPSLLQPAVGGMFQLKYAAQELIKNPIPGNEKYNAGPSFEYLKVEK
ncbi:MAG: ferritin-like domain-containing protein [Tumebacillaceae bacterium]